MNKQYLTLLCAFLLAVTSARSQEKPTIFWQNGSGKLASWMFAGTEFSSSVPVPGREVNWQVLGSADFNWDGQEDLLWLNDVTGRLEIALMQGTNVVTVDYVRSAPTSESGWTLLGIGDLNQDASPDLLWSRPNGQMILWQMDGTKFVKASWFHGGRTVNPAWRLAAIADLDGDNKNDVLWQHANGQIALSQVNELKIDGSSVLQNGKRYSAWKVAGTVDFDGDEHEDILWRHNDGRVAVWRMNGTELSNVQVLRNGFPVPQSWRIIGSQ